MAQNHPFSNIVFRLADCAFAHSNIRSVGQAGNDVHNHDFNNSFGQSCAHGLFKVIVLLELTDFTQNTRVSSSSSY